MDVCAIVVTYNAEPYLTRCLESIRTHPTVVVDHGSSDGTTELVRERFPEAHLAEQENRGLAAGWNAGMRLAGARYYLLLNADAWVEPAAIDELVAFADDHADAAIVGPRLRYPDGRLQPSVRAFPTLWRLATDYLFLRRLAPRSRLFNGFYAGDFSHDEVRSVDWLVGACLLVRSEAVSHVGNVDEGYFLFTEETDWCYRFRRAGWKIYFDPRAEVVHVGGAAHQGRFFREQVRGYLRFLSLHHGRRKAEQARRLMLFAFRVRGLILRGPSGDIYRDAAAWLASGPASSFVAPGADARP